MLKAAGVKPGVCDIFIPDPRGGYAGFYIELKVKGGTVKKEQIEYMTDMVARGYRVAICWNLDVVMDEINQYMKLKPNYE